MDGIFSVCCCICRLLFWSTGVCSVPLLAEFLYIYINTNKFKKLSGHESYHITRETLQSWRQQSYVHLYTQFYLISSSFGHFCCDAIFSSHFLSSCRFIKPQPEGYVFGRSYRLYMKDGHSPSSGCQIPLFQHFGHFSIFFKASLVIKVFGYGCITHT